MKAVDFNNAEIQDLKANNKQIATEIQQLKASNAILMEKNSQAQRKNEDLEAYQRRWNLRLNGLKEEKDEDRKKRVAGVIVKILPHWSEKMDMILDTVHRLGAATNGRPKQIITQFALRTHREDLWRATKGHPICRDLGIRFAEDLTKEEREARLVLWPKVEQARKAGQKAVFRGRHAFINGQRVTA